MDMKELFGIFIITPEIFMKLLDFVEKSKQFVFLWKFGYHKIFLI